jgi:hypothetical protein
LSGRNGRSDSITGLGKAEFSAGDRSSRASNGLTKIPEQMNDIFECMVGGGLTTSSPFVENPGEQDSTNPNMNIKKPVPNKYKTEICRNWKLEGF